MMERTAQGKLWAMRETEVDMYEYSGGGLNIGLSRKGRKVTESRHPDVEDLCPLGLPRFPRPL